MDAGPVSDDTKDDSSFDGGPLTFGSGAFSKVFDTGFNDGDDDFDRGLLTCDSDVVVSKVFDIGFDVSALCETDPARG